MTNGPTKQSQAHISIKVITKGLYHRYVSLDAIDNNKYCLLKGNQEEEVTPDDEVFVDIRKNRPRRPCRAPTREFIRRSRERISSLNIEDSLINGEVQPQAETTSQQEDPNKWKIIQSSFVDELTARKDDRKIEQAEKIIAKVSITSSPPTPPWMTEWKSKKRIGRSNTFAFSSTNSRNPNVRYSEQFHERIVTERAFIDKTRKEENGTANNLNGQQRHEIYKTDATNGSMETKDLVKTAMATEGCIQSSTGIKCEAVNLACKGNTMLTEGSGSYEQQNKDAVVINNDDGAKNHSLKVEGVEKSLQNGYNNELLFEPKVPVSDTQTTKELHPDKLMAEVATVLEITNSESIHKTLATLVEAVRTINENVAALRKTVEEMNKKI